VKNKKNNDYIRVLISAVLWGSLPVFTRLLYTFGNTPIIVSACRGYIAAGIIVVWFALNGTFKKLKLREIPFYLLYGAVAIGGCFILYATAMKMLSTAMAAILLYTGPAFVILLNRIFYKEPITKIKVGALILTVVGCILTVRAYDIGELRAHLGGIAIGLLSGLCYSMTTVLGERAKRYQDGVTNGGLMLISGSLVFLIIQPPWTIPALSKMEILLFLGIAIIGSVIPYTLYLSSLDRGMDGGIASIVATVEPVCGVLCGVLIFGEMLDVFQIIGIVLVVAGVSIPILHGKINQKRLAG